MVQLARNLRLYYLKSEHLIIQHFVEQNYSKFCFKYCDFLVM